jgi:hypothetical protein
MVRPKAWVVLRSITNAKLERHLLLRCDWMAEKNRTRSGEAGRGVLNTSGQIKQTYQNRHRVSEQRLNS